MKVYCSITAPIRPGLSWLETWRGSDNGLIKCWEVGREKSISNPELAQQARSGELPVLGWKGGVEKKIAKKFKYGTLNYLAMWQGLRGEDLNIDTTLEVSLVCSRTDMEVIYTCDPQKYAEL